MIFSKTNWLISVVIPDWANSQWLHIAGDDLHIAHSKSEGQTAEGGGAAQGQIFFGRGHIDKMF